MSANKTSTRERVLEAACGIFAEKGFRDATVAEICEAANANIAAVNYHFRDKETLYDEVWRYAFAITTTAYPVDGGITEDASPEEMIHAFASAILHRIFSESEEGLFAKLLYREIASPTLALEKIASQALFPQIQQVERIIREVLGEDVDEATLLLCKLSIVGQCAFFNFSRPLHEYVLGKKSMTNEEIEAAARHIARFSIGGLRKVGGLDA